MGSKTKVNLFLSDVVTDIVSYGIMPQSVLCWALQVLHDMIGTVYNDEATSWVIWASLAYQRGKVTWLGLMHCTYDTLKDLSDSIKGMGVLGCTNGSLLVEMHTMQGRGCAPVDWEDELDKRTNPERQTELLAPFSDAQIADAIDRVVSEEMPISPDFISAECAFNTRFATTKGGSHSSVGSVLARDYIDELPKMQLTRRHFVESLHTNPLLRTKPGAWISRSMKLEHGKTRALFACDTANLSLPGGWGFSYQNIRGG